MSRIIKKTIIFVSIIILLNVSTNIIVKAETIDKNSQNFSSSREKKENLYSQKPSKKLPLCANTDCDCKDFKTQVEAQQVLNAFSGDPHRLDRDKDGVACEHLP
ncbi:excalibur calcium-binding domain-containing protein [Cyanobacterium sp. Dongsha4]|uniref:excalibur calcium-binding domain-containing protein n=1 Tax=Cyanobacterium sp. DS4 TaxID=2878255 RepID=UPI002E820FDF|nr:excalibur calcium-binding domain-containing protein [Cyanobacterium sp. Dongsha4]WVK99354.1 excalibur calcium-binding domain-containing protein [Cyanobacterium sp. Dongsha4]